MRSGKFCSLIWFVNCDYRNLSAHFLTGPANSKSKFLYLLWVSSLFVYLETPLALLLSMAKTKIQSIQKYKQFFFRFPHKYLPSTPPLTT